MVTKDPSFLHADAQADLSLRWAHSHFVGFVMSRLSHGLQRLPFSLPLLDSELGHCTMAKPHRQECSNVGTITVSFLNIRTPRKFVLITLKFVLCGSTTE